MRPKVQQIGARWHRPSAVSVRGGGWGSRAHPHLGGPSRIRSPSTSHSWNSRDPTWLPSLHEWPVDPKQVNHGDEQQW